MKYEKKRRYITEARDAGGRGFTLNRFLVEFNLAKSMDDANHLIRTGAVDIDNRKVKDILHLLLKGTYDVKIHGDFVAEATVL